MSQPVHYLTCPQVDFAIEDTLPRMLEWGLVEELQLQGQQGAAAAAAAAVDAAAAGERRFCAASADMALQRLEEVTRQLYAKSVAAGATNGSRSSSSNEATGTGYNASNGLAAGAVAASNSFVGISANSMNGSSSSTSSSSSGGAGSGGSGSSTAVTAVLPAAARTSSAVRSAMHPAAGLQQQQALRVWPMHKGHAGRAQAQRRQLGQLRGQRLQRGPGLRAAAMHTRLAAGAPWVRW